jgi:hypothetical protein
MFYFQRKSLPQIAAELQLSVNTVRNQKTQALLFLRKSIPTVMLAIFLQSDLLRDYNKEFSQPCLPIGLEDTIHNLSKPVA